MATSNNNSFIDAAITELSTGIGKYAELATAIQRQTYSSPIERIGIMLQRINGDKLEARKSGNEYSGIKPGQLLAFVQKVQNKVCWSARRVVKSAVTEEAVECTNGMDFSQDFLDEVNIDPVDIRNIAKLVDEDFSQLTNIHNWLSSQMGDWGSQVDPLSYFIQKELVSSTMTESGTDWVTTYETFDFEVTMDVLDKIAEELADKSAELDYARAERQLAELAAA